MKNLSLLVITILLFISVSAQKIQKLDEYKASNGITYKIGDEIKLGRGSNDNGSFVYVTMGGWAAANGDVSGLPPANAGLLVTVKKIRKFDYKHQKGVYFTVGGGNITNYNLDIESAIQTCEIQDCKEDNVAKSDSKDGSDMFEQLKKLKELHDTGILTKEEYEKEKKEILDKNN